MSEERLAACGTHAWTLVTAMADVGGIWSVSKIAIAVANDDQYRCGFCGKDAEFVARRRRDGS